MVQDRPTVSNVSAVDAYETVTSETDARLVDVRTRAEWTFVGLPDLPGSAHDPILLEWQSFPSMSIASDFGQALEEACPDKTTALYFLCRSGGRSLAAAKVMSERGYTRCFNVADGFEGPPDAEGHRGSVAGWKADGLPWRQS
ncbi:MAG: rhodanese-like domain-containing protein [Devosia sp.]